MGELVSSVLKPLLDDVKDKVVTSLTMYWGIDDSRRTLELHLHSMQNVLADAKAKFEQPGITNWLKEVKLSAYCADTVLDSFRYLDLRERAQIVKSGLRKKQDHLVQNRSLDKTRLTMELKDVTDSMNKLAMEMRKFKLLSSLPAREDTSLERRTFSSNGPSEELFGRKVDKETIIDLLLAQEHQRGVQVLPIVGMGGVGKTAIANEIFTDEKLHKHFPLKLWLFVPDGIDLCGVLRLLVEVVTKKKCCTESIEVLKGEVVKAIANERFLLVMDDISSCNQWGDKVYQILSLAASAGSCVMLTTRCDHVAKSIGTLKTYNLEYLDEKDSWEFFSKKAFSKEVLAHQRKYEDLVGYAKAIAKKCQGLPLALKVISATMSEKHLVSDWRSAAEKSTIKHTESGDRILQLLKISFDQLSPESKICFAFLAFFPKRSSLDKQRVIQMWVGLGYVRGDDRIDVEERGELVFEDLVSRCMLEAVTATEPHWQYDPIKYCMHDLLHDLARSINDECVSVQDLVQSKVVGIPLKFACHLMIPQCSPPECQGIGEAEIGEALDGMTHVRTLWTVQPIFKTMGKGPKQLHLRSLRVLQTQDLPNLYRQLEYLVHLRFLDLSGSELVNLPDSISLLYHLHTLNLNGCLKLESLPDSLGYMTQLYHLDLTDCWLLKKMPRNMGRLVKLHTLTRYIVNTEDGRGIGELKDMRLLRNTLEIYGLSNVQHISSAMDVGLRAKDRITNLVLSFTEDPRDSVVEPLGEEEIIKHEDLLKYLEPHSDVEHLTICDYGGRNVPSWMQKSQNFQHIKSLRIFGGHSCVDVPLVWLSHTLEYLELHDFPNLVVLCRDVDMTDEGFAGLHFVCGNALPIMFPSLEVLAISSMPKFTQWAQTTEVVFPKLQMLSIDNCGEIGSVPNCPVLEIIEVQRCPRLHLSAFQDMRTLLRIRYRFPSDDARESNALERFPLNKWSALRILSMDRLDLTETASLPDNSQRIYLKNLQTLGLNGTGCFSGQPRLWDYFGYIEVLNISCVDIVTWPIEILQLMCLKVLNVVCCSELATTGPSTTAVFPPNLEILYVCECNKLIEIPQLPKSLQDLTVYSCPELTAVLEGPGRSPSLPNLRTLGLFGCTKLKKLPNGECASLQFLTIHDSPKIKLFPEEILLRMHDKDFQHLYISGCPNLQALCINGPYSILVSNIRFKDVGSCEKQTRPWLSCLCPGTTI